jgi:hypothetical protein
MVSRPSAKNIEIRRITGGLSVPRADVSKEKQPDSYQRRVVFFSDCEFRLTTFQNEKNLYKVARIAPPSPTFPP